MYKRNVGLLPTKVGEYFECRAPPTHSYNLRKRSTALHRQIKFKTSTGENSIQIRGDKLWCNIPKYIQDSTSLSIFKKQFKEFLLLQSQKPYYPHLILCWRPWPGHIISERNIHWMLLNLDVELHRTKNSVRLGTIPDSEP